MTRSLGRRAEHELKAEANIGKRGVTEGLLAELERRLKSRRRIKVRINRNALASGLKREDVAREVARRLNARLVEIRGRTFVIEKIESRGREGE
ncbi:MAG: YhbY family RNA-binding protein [Fervidicoccaceae archaeon]